MLPFLYTGYNEAEDILSLISVAVSEVDHPMNAFKFLNGYTETSSDVIVDDNDLY